MRTSFILLSVLVSPLCAEAGEFGHSNPPQWWIAVGPSAGLELAGTKLQGLAGAELTAGRIFGTGYSDWEAGAFAQAEWTFNAGPRVALGARANWSIFGVELGGALQLRTDGLPPTWLVQIAPFVATNFLSLSLRVGVPVSPSTEPIAIGLVLGVKVPWAWYRPNGPEASRSWDIWLF